MKKQKNKAPRARNALAIHAQMRNSAGAMQDRRLKRVSRKPTTKELLRDFS